MPETLNIARDYFRFVLAFFDVINTSASHIYISALPLSPQTSIVCKLYKQYACPLVRIVQGLPISWDPVLATVYHEDFEWVVTWSPCSRFIAVAKSATIEILDAVTFEQLNTFKSPHGIIDRRLGFSPDGHTLTQFDEEKLTSWDLQTGSPAGTVFSERGDVPITNSFSSTYSTDGKILAVLSDSSKNPTLITAYDLLSKVHTYSYPVPEGHIVTPIWTHSGCLHFVTVKPGSITLWEAAFTSVHTPTKVKSLPAPDEITNMEDENFLFLPASSQLAFTVQGTILVWDAQYSRFLLKSCPVSASYLAGFHGMSFSSDGHLFSYTTRSGEVYVWKRSPTSYTLHQKIAFPLAPVELFLSPNGESIIAAGPSTIHLWHTRDQILSLPSVPVHENGGTIILGFSPDGVLVATAHLRRDTVTIFDLQSGEQWLIIDAGMGVQCLKIVGSTIVVAGQGKITSWNLSAQSCANTRVNINDSVHTTMICGLGFSTVQSISPDLSCIATLESGKSCNIKIHDISTGGQLACVKMGSVTSHGLEWITLGEQEVWCMDGENSLKGWKIIRDSKSSTTELESLESTVCPPQALPWQSCCGYKVCHDGWVLGPTQKRLMWLPHHWRSLGVFRTWSGQFLGLGQSGLQEAVILEFLG